MILIDTDILIDAGRGMQEALQLLERDGAKSELAVSVVTQMELIVGCRSKAEAQKLERFLGRFDVVAVTPSISTAAVELLRRYRLSHGLLIADSLIAATAMSLDVALRSKNQRDYRFIEGLELLPYPPGA